MHPVFNIILSASFITLVSWLSGKKGHLAGFLTALPLTTLIALVLSNKQYSGEVAVDYAKSVFAAIPISLLFFIPFLLATKLNLSFWACYIAGVILLGFGYFIHQFIGKFF